jgi:hypothetical protein
MNKSKIILIAIASMCGFAILGASLFYFFKKDPYEPTAREVTVGVELLAREYAANGMTFGAMITQSEISKRNFDSLLLKLPAPTSDKERENEKLVKDYILSASSIAYTLGRYLNVHVQMEVANKNSSTSSDTTVCGSNYASFDMTLCLMRVRARQQQAFAEVDRLRAAKAIALADKNLSLSKFTSAREKLAKVGYDVDVQNSNIMSQLGKNI